MTLLTLLKATTGGGGATVAVDASSPVLSAALHDPWVSASFTPPNNSLLVVGVMGDFFGGTPSLTPTSSGLTFVSKKRQGATNQGVAEIFTAEVGSSGGTARTVSVTTNLVSDPGAVKVWVVTGQDPTAYVDATGGGTSATNNLTVAALTTVADNALVLGIGTEWQNLGAPTSTDSFENSPQPGDGISVISVRKAGTVTPAGSVNLNFDAAGASAPTWTWAAISIAPAASGITGTVAVTQAPNTSTATGKLGYSGSSARTQAANTSTASGTVINPATGTSAAGQAAQIATATGKLGCSGTVARTQANQTSTASGTFAAMGVSGNAAVTQSPDAASSSGQLGYTGSAAATQEDDASESFGHLDSGGPDVSLLAAYNFDEASGAVVDVTGNGHDFTPDATITRQTGHTNTGLRHESTAANSLGPAIFGQTAARTMMCWVKRTSNAIDGWVLEMKNTTADTGVWGFLYSGSTIQARAKNPSNVATFASAAQPTVNVFHHLAMTYDGTTIRLFIDGVQAATAAFTGPVWTSATIFPFFDTVGIETVIDDVRLYDAALDAATITTLMGTPVSSGGTTGTAALTQAADTSAASGQLGYAGTATPTQAANTSSASGTVTGSGISGNAAVTQAANTASALGQLGYSGTATPTQAAQTSTATGKLGYSGSSTASQAAQTSTASGQLGYTGTAATSQAAQTSSASGIVSSPGSFSGSAAVTQANQTGSASGQLGYSGTSARTQANNTSTAAGTVVNPVTGAASPTQANQFSITNGILRYTGTVAVSQGSNAATIQGIAFIPITGTLAETQANQTANASGSALGSVVIRPNTGTTSKPGSGRTIRPFTGVSPQP